MRGNPQLDNADIQHRRDFWTKCVAIKSHGDGVPVVGVGKSWNKMLDIWSWTSCLGSGATLDCCFYMFSIFQPLLSNIAGQKTYVHIAHRLRWSFYWLWLGRWPTHDADGNAYLPGTVEYRRAHDVVWLADGLFALLWVISGDLDFHAAFMGFPRTTAASPCGLCPCTNREGDMPWSDYRTDPPAEWMQNMWGPEQYADAHPDRHPWLTLPGVTLLSVCIDWMHVKYLGTDQYFLGSVLYLLVFVLMGGEPATNLETVWNRVKEHYTQNRVTARFRILKLSMFRSGPGGYPRLKGKAAEIKHLAPALLSVWRSGMDVDDDDHQRVRIALETGVRLDTILDEHTGEWRLSPDAAQEFLQTALTHVQMTCSVANLHGMRLFNITLKTHYLIHAAYRGLHMNPRVGWCFMGEDYMKKMKALSGSCCRGVALDAVGLKQLKKYLVAMHFQLTDSGCRRPDAV